MTPEVIILISTILMFIAVISAQYVVLFIFNKNLQTSKEQFEQTIETIKKQYEIAENAHESRLSTYESTLKASEDRFELGVKESRKRLELDKKRIKAELVAKERVNWMEQVRNAFVEYREKVMLVQTFYSRNVDATKGNRKNFDYDVQYVELQISMETAASRLSLYFNPSSEAAEDRKVISLIQKMNKLSIINDLRSEGHRVAYYEDCMLVHEELSVAIQEYLKYEYDKVKQELSLTTTKS